MAQNTTVPNRSRNKQAYTPPKAPRQGDSFLSTGIAAAFFSLVAYTILGKRALPYLAHYLTPRGGVIFVYYFILCLSVIAGLFIAGLVVKNPNKKQGGFFVPFLAVSAIMVILAVFMGLFVPAPELGRFRITVNRSVMNIVLALPYSLYDFLSTFEIIPYLGDGLMAAFFGLIGGIVMALLIKARNADRAVMDTVPVRKRTRPAIPAPQRGRNVEPVVRSTSSELEKYQALVDADIMTPEEFAVKRKQLLGK